MKKIMRGVVVALGAATALVALTAGEASAQIQLNLLANVNLSSTANSANAEFVGSNISAVTWDGTNAWIGGYNNSGTAGTTAIVKVSNVLGGSPALGTAFGSLTTSAFRGITSLAIQGGVLAAAWDNGAGSGDSVREFNATTNSLNWRIGDAGAGNDSTRRGNGVAFDPGFNGAGTNQGVAYLSIGTGRRHLLNTTNGQYINGQNAGAIINFATVSTSWRDLAFDPDTGDLYTRESNRIGKATRNGDNTFTGGASVDLGTGLTVNANLDVDNIAFAKSTEFGKFLIANDRSVSSGATLANTLKFYNTSGGALTASILGIDSTSVSGNAYDFSFDAASQTLAISDFTNRRLYVFGVGSTPAVTVPEPGTLALALVGLGGAGLLARRRMSKGQRTA